LGGTHLDAPPAKTSSRSPQKTRHSWKFFENTRQTQIRCPVVRVTVAPFKGELAMHIGLLTLEILIPDAHSLKEKRLVLRSLKDRLRKFNVSVAECEHQDLWQRATLGIVSICSDHLILEKTLNSVVEETEKTINGSLSDYQIEYL
jgi:uncharacterized protein YlxP (DUF503 family)